MSIIAIAGTIGAIAGVVKSLKEVHGIVDSDRAIAIAVQNHTGHTLRTSREGHRHGGWGDPPDHEVPAGQASVFSVRDKGFMTGVEGSLTYEILGTDPQAYFLIRWNNPFIGGNDAGAWDFVYMDTPNDWPSFFPRMPISSDAFRTYSGHGSGNISQNNYELHPN